MHSGIRVFLFLPLFATLCSAQQPGPTPSPAPPPATAPATQPTAQSTAGPAPQPSVPPAAPPQTVVVTGTFIPLALDEIDRTVSVLPARGLDLPLDSIADLLRLDALDLQARAPGGVQTDLSIRGSTFGQTLVLLNGQRLNDAQTGHHNMDIPVPLESVERVEVLRGSGSALYGSDASGGVVNVITAPPEGWEVRLRGAAGNDGINQQHVSLAGSLGALSEQLAASRDFSSGFRPDRDYRNLQLASTTSLLTVLGRSTLTLAYMDRPFGADQFYGPYPSWEDTKTWWLGFQQALGKRTWFQFAYRRHSDLFVLVRDNPPLYTNHHHDQDFQTSLRRSDPLSANTTVSYGADALHESIVSTNLGTYARSRGAVYAAVDFRALKRFSLSVAAREEVYRNFSGQLSPTVSGGAWLTRQLKLRASASRAFRMPTYTDLYYSDPANRGNPNLRPEHAWTYEAGLDWSPASRLRAGVTAFERRERNGIDYYRATPGAAWQALNIDSLNFTGVESWLRLALGARQSLDLRYCWLLGVQDTVPIGATRYTFNYPGDSGAVVWQAGLPGGIVARTRLGVLNRQAQGTYPLWDFHAAWTRGRVHPFVQLANITSASYQEIQGVAMPGRTVVGGVEIVLRRR